MYAGKIVEIAGRDALYQRPMHPYTQALLSAVPVPDPRVQRARRRITYAGEPPNPLEPPPGCRFQSRCSHRTGQCRLEDPPLEERGAGHWVACWNS
jgi:peptide/nickel transport system ATP-binding protein